MKITTTWQKCYDMESEIEYLGEHNSGEHYFKIVRKELESLWGPEEDECFALIEDGVVVFEGYAYYPSPEEVAAMKEVLIKNQSI